MKELLLVICLSIVPTSAQFNSITIGTGKSQGKLTPTETELFTHNVSADGKWAYLNHFWAAGSSQVDRAIFRYYVDGEATPSIEFTPALACGVGFGDQTAPWGTKWVGKGAKTTGWFHNIPIPFYKSIRVTFQLNPLDTQSAEIWSIVRGSEGLPLKLGMLELPLDHGVKLELQRKDSQTLAPLEFVDIASVPQGTMGSIFMTFLAINGTSNYNYMEGCFHMYSPPTQAWPGLLLSTGMEDFYDSAFYFDGGGFHSPVSGQTHKPGDGTFSGYRFHEMDPLVFKDGVRMQWRNGDVTDPATGLKCTLEKGGGVIGSPGPSQLTSYAWVYTWKPQKSAETIDVRV